MTKRRPKHHYRAVYYTDASGFGGPGADGRARGYADAWHRTNVEHSPFCVPNELICASIGRFLGLPIPPFAITYGPDGSYLFSSLDFNYSRDQLPPILPDVSVAQLPDICTGILLFDILVANNDRHDMNLVVDNVSNPREMCVFDHDQALFGGGFPLKGVERLEVLRDRLGVSGSDVSNGNRHCLLDVLNTNRFFDKWLDRFYSMPSWFIEETCQSAEGYGIGNRESRAAVEFLKYRKSNLEEIIRINQDSFRGITSWTSPGELL